jgi:hypothetical protein
VHQNVRSSYEQFESEFSVTPHTIRRHTMAVLFYVHNSDMTYRSLVMVEFYKHQIFETSDGGLINEHGEVLIRVTGYKGYPGLYKTRGLRRT